MVTCATTHSNSTSRWGERAARGGGCSYCLAAVFSFLFACFLACSFGLAAAWANEEPSPTLSGDDAGEWSSALVSDEGVENAALSGTDASGATSTGLVAGTPASTNKKEASAESDVAGNVTSLQALFVSKNRFSVKWAGGNKGNKFEVQIREALTTNVTWNKATTTTNHRATVKKNGSQPLKEGSYYLIRVRAVAKSGEGPWSKILLVRAKAPVSSRIYAHKGSFNKASEAHTFKSYDRAIKEGSKNLELDVVLSKDGSLYVSHDLDTKATTGKNLRFSKLTNKQINNLKTKSGEKIHTLEAVFKHYGNSLTYLVELKEGSKQIEAFSDFMTRCKPANVIVQSNNLKVLKVLSQRFPDIQTLFLSYTSKRVTAGISNDSVDIIAMKSSLASAKNVKRVQAVGKVASTFTLNRINDIKMMIKRNMDTYFTDHTGRAIMVEKTYRK